MKKLCLTLLTSFILYTAADGMNNDPATIIKQPVFKGHEVFERDHSRVGQEVLERMRDFPSSEHVELEKIFSSDNGKQLLWRVRGYGSPQGCLLPEGKQKVQQLIEQTHGMNLPCDITDHACAFIPSINREVLIPLLSTGRRVTPSGCIQDVYNCEFNMLSSLLYWAKIKNALHQRNKDEKVELPEDMRAWHFSHILHPDIAECRFSDLDFLVTQKPLSPGLTNPTEFKQHLKDFCVDEENRKLLCTLAYAGIWSTGQLGFGVDGKLQVRKFQQPDNTLPNEFMQQKKLAWNRHAFFSSLADKLQGEAQHYFKQEDEEALQEFEKFKKQENQES